MKGNAKCRPSDSDSEDGPESHYYINWGQRPQRIFVAPGSAADAADKDVADLTQESVNLEVAEADLLADGCGQGHSSADVLDDTDGLGADTVGGMMAANCVNAILESTS